MQIFEKEIINIKTDNGYYENINYEFFFRFAIKRLKNIKEHLFIWLLKNAGFIFCLIKVILMIRKVKVGISKKKKETKTN